MVSSNSYLYPPVTFKVRYLIIIIFLFLAHNLPLGNAYGKEPFYSIQLDTFNNLENAEKRVAELKGLGHNSFYRTETLKGDEGEIYKVFIEHYESRSEAENEAKVLKDLELIPGYIIVEIGEEKEETKDEEVEKKTQQPESIKKEEVEKEAPPPDSVKEEPGDNGLLIQVGAFKEKENAEKTLLKLKDSGHSAFYRREAVRGKGELYRVYLKGPQSKAEAEKTGKGLIESGLISGYILKIPGGKAQVVIPTGEDTKKSFFLHVSSYKEEANAEQCVQFLTDNELKAFYVEEEVLGSKWFRVYIGKFDDEASARKAGSELLEKGIISYFKPLEINRGNNRR